MNFCANTAGRGGWRIMLITTTALTFVGLSLAPASPVMAQSAQGEAGVLEEIVVTARKREESLQDTPISITAFSERGLLDRGITDLAGLGEFTPNLVFDHTSAIAATSSAAAIYIRGIGQIDWALPTDPGVGLYLDGVYIARTIGGVMDVLEVERIEVLKGPQGTLFGRNTIGGAISVTTKKPDISDFFGSAEVTTGRYNRIDTRVYLNAPLGDKAAVSVAASRKERGGFVKNVNPGVPDLGDENALSFRVAARFLPSDRVTVDISFDYTREREAPAPFVLLDVQEFGFFTLVTNGAIFPINTHGRQVDAVCAVPFDPAGLTNPTCFNDQWVLGPFKTASTHTSFNPFVNTILGRPMTPEADLDLWGVSGDISWEVADWLTIRNIAAYRSVWGFWARDIDHSPGLFLQTVNDYEQTQFTEELQFLGNHLDGRLNWIGGVYYFTEDGCHLDVVELPGAVFDSGGCIDNSNVAIFGQATYNLTDKLAVTGGFRWTDETKKFFPESTVGQDDGLGIPAGVPVLPFVARGDEICSSDLDVQLACLTTSKIDPLFNVAYNWTDDVMTYFTFSTGFKGGTFTQRVFPPRPDVPAASPEKVETFEIGFKSTMANRRVRFNGAFFFTDYTDLQVNVFERTSPDAPETEIGIVTRNAAQAEIKGFELELFALVTDNTTLEVGVGYLDADYTEIDGAAAAAGLTLESKLVNTPKWTINVGLSHIFEVANGWLVVPRVDWSYTDEIANDGLNTPLLIQDGYSVLNLRMRVEDPDGKWELGAGVQNVTNTIYLVAGDNSQDGVTEGSFGRPREWFLSVKRKF